MLSDSLYHSIARIVETEIRTAGRHSAEKVLAVQDDRNVLSGLAASRVSKGAALALDARIFPLKWPDILEPLGALVRPSPHVLGTGCKPEYVYESGAPPALAVLTRRLQSWSPSIFMLDPPSILNDHGSQRSVC